MVIEEYRRHHPESDEPTNSEDICLSDNVSTCPSVNKNNTIEETALVHSQPTNRQIVEIYDDDDDDDDDEGSSSSYVDEDENKRKWVAAKLPQTCTENKVTNSDNTTITNNHKTVIQAPSVVINKNFYPAAACNTCNHLVHIDNLDRIDVVPANDKITIDKDPETNVEPKSSDTSSQPLCEQDKDSKWCSKRRLLTISGAVLLGLAIIGIIAYFLIPDSCDVCIVSRKEWNARSPKGKANPLAVLPAKYVIIIHTRTANCSTKTQCTRRTQEVQNYDMELNKTDIAYNWLVGGDGLVYECRGWDVEGDHTKNYNNKSIGIGFIGTFKKDEPSKEQIGTGKMLIKKAVEEKHISTNYKLVGQRQCLQTPSDSPGDKLYEIIKKWDRYSPACL